MSNMYNVLPAFREIASSYLLAMTIKKVWVIARNEAICRYMRNANLKIGSRYDVVRDYAERGLGYTAALEKFPTCLMHHEYVFT
jgi:hypothetical protein